MVDCWMRKNSGGRVPAPRQYGCPERIPGSRLASPAEDQPVIMDSLTLFPYIKILDLIFLQRLLIRRESKTRFLRNVHVAVLIH